MNGISAAAPVREVLMNPGPVMTNPLVRAALAGPDLCHREPEFAELMTRVRAKLTRIVGGTDTCTTVVLTASGTSAIEAAIISAVPDGGEFLSLENGHYGERLHHIATVHGIPTHRLELPWGTSIDPTAVERFLAEQPAVTHIGVVHHETSTGMLNDVAAIASAARAHGAEVVVDAVSSIGAEDLDIERDGIDWLAGSSNKCLEGMPGLSFVTARRIAFEGLGTGFRRSYSLDLHRHFVAQAEANAPAFTPAIPLFYALDAALDLVLAEGVAARGLRYRILAERLRAGLQRLGLRILLGAEDRAAGLTAVELPQGLTYNAVHDSLRAKGFIVYAAQEHLAQNFFRLSTMGQMTAADIDRFLEALGFLLGELKGQP